MSGIASAIGYCTTIAFWFGHVELYDPESDWGHDEDEAGGEDE